MTEDPNSTSLPSREAAAQSEHVQEQARELQAHTRKLRARSVEARGAVRRAYRRHIAGGSADESRVIGVVDDDASIVRALTRLLRTVGFSVRGFTSGEELLAWDGLETLDCLIVDVHLGGLTGFDVQERIASMRSSLPVIFITAHDDAGTSERARRNGEGQYLRKPFDESALIGAIHTALERQRTLYP
jgi:CheY-like chemotaxis protein